MNVIDCITITCNLKKVRLQIISDYKKKCNRLQLITITPYLLRTIKQNQNQTFNFLLKLSGNHNMIKIYYSMFNCNQNYHRYKQILSINYGFKDLISKQTISQFQFL
jgi:hypothetical protein